MKLKNETVFNVVFWTLYFLYQWFGLASLYGDFGGYFINACMAFPVSVIFAFLTVHIYFKFLYQKNRKKTFWLALIISSICLLLIRRYVNYFIIYPKHFPHALEMPFFSFAKLLVEIANLYAIIGLYALYYFILYWYRERDNVQKLLQQNTLAELNTLKSQVQPHFVFNTLNNIYASAVKSSPETATLIAHLSGFLDYNLYESSKDKVQLTAEILYMEHYIALQKNRYGSRLDASITIHNDLSELYIAPLLLLPLLENSCKHGVAETIDNAWICMDVSRDLEKFSIRIENSVDGNATGIRETTGGIGLANVSKRLQLIYPGKHDFEITHGEYSYLVLLEIKIA